MTFLRYLLFPFSCIYYLITTIRNLLYDKGLMKSEYFDFPVISVGNIHMGGTGKTPMVEYLVRLLEAAQTSKKKNKGVSILSRGYGRMTKGFLQVTNISTSNDVGDEPKQYFSKFPNTLIAVCEDRVKGIKELCFSSDIILLDDAFQHRTVKPGLNILLMNYQQVFQRSFVLPTGDLRESKAAMKRADIIVVTKGSKIFSPIEQRRIKNQIKPLPHQKIYSSYIKYEDLVLLHGSDEKKITLSDIKRKTSIILLTGVANPQPLVDFLQLTAKNVLHFPFRDHYKFKPRDILTIKNAYLNIKNDNKVIITTEKDAMRLQTLDLDTLLNDIPIYYLPIRCEIVDKLKSDFDNTILNYARQN